MQWKKLIKGIAFIILFAVLFTGASRVLTTPGDYRNYQWIAGFYEEPEDSLDAVYVSSSTAYAYWNSLVAWDQYGIAVYPYTSNSQHFITTEHLIKEVRKTQPDALFIVNTNSIDDKKMVVEEFHHLLDYMPFSFNKLQLTGYLAKTAELDWEETLELYVPLYRYHDRWSEVSSEDISYQIDGLKGTSTYNAYLKKAVDITNDYSYVEGQEKLAAHISDAAISLMDYCEKENVRVLFVTVPRVETEQRIRQLNELNAMLEERGFDTLNLLKDPEPCSLDLVQDFYNAGHTNVHGSVKYTQFLSEYLIEHYGFTNKHGDENYASWDAGYQKYEKTLNQYVLDIELDLHHRTTLLGQPANLTADAAADSVELHWEASESADGYAVYRKQDKKAWELLTMLNDLHFTDTTVEAGAEYYYTVVPFMTEDDQNFYGEFDYKGICVQTQGS